MPELMTALCADDSLASYALRFAILTACRTGEVLGATWPEIDTEAALWVVPAGRIEHPGGAVRRRLGPSENRCAAAR